MVTEHPIRPGARNAGRLGAATLAVAVLTFAVALAGSPPANAAFAPPNPRYVTVHRKGSQVVLRPTRQLLRHDGGRRITVICFSTPREGADGISTVGSTSTRTRLRRGMSFPVPGGTRDYCFIRLAPRHGTTPPQQQIGLTRRGRSHLRLRNAVIELAGYATVAFALNQHGLPSTEALAAQLHLVPLASPDATADRGAIGIWSDGHSRLMVTTTLGDGRRPFLDYDHATNITRTNFLDMLIEIADG